jgi:hypothetical protein
MKKITESQLKDKVNSLREYLKVYENQQVDEWSVLSPSSWFNGRDYGDSTSRDDVRAQDATKNVSYGADQAMLRNREQLAPGSVASEQGKDGVTYAVDAKGMRTFKIENGKWVAMNPPTPTEQPELMAAPAAPAPQTSMDTDDEAGTHAFDPTWGGTVATGGQTVAPNAGAEWNNATQTAVAKPEPGADKIARFKELLAKAKPASQYALSAKGAKLKANESTSYFLSKLRLIESRQLNEELTPEEQKELDTLAQSYGDSEDPEIAGLLQQYSDVKNAAMAARPDKPAEPAQAAAPAEPAQAAAVTPAAPAGPVTWKQIYELNKDIIGANPNLIKPGQQLKMPDGSTYTVKPGDNLTKIAKGAGGGGQGASVTPTAPKAPAAPTAPKAPDAKVPPVFTNGNYQKVAEPAPNAPGQNARDDLLARQGKGQKKIDLSNSTQYTDGTPRVTKESVGYNELQRIVSLVNHR